MAPKSTRCRVLSADKSRLDGFKSQYVMPWLCRKANRRHSARPHSSIFCSSKPCSLPAAAEGFGPPHTPSAKKRSFLRRLPLYRRESADDAQCSEKTLPCEDMPAFACLCHLSVSMPATVRLLFLSPDILCSCPFRSAASHTQNDSFILQDLRFLYLPYTPKQAASFALSKSCKRCFCFFTACAMIRNGGIPI